MHSIFFIQLNTEIFLIKTSKLENDDLTLGLNLIQDLSLYDQNYFYEMILFLLIDIYSDIRNRLKYAFRVLNMEKNIVSNDIHVKYFNELKIIFKRNIILLYLQYLSQTFEYRLFQLLKKKDFLLNKSETSFSNYFKITSYNPIFSKVRTSTILCHSINKNKIVMRTIMSEIKLSSNIYDSIDPLFYEIGAKHRKISGLMLWMENAPKPEYHSYKGFLRPDIFFNSLEFFFKNQNLSFESFIDFDDLNFYEKSPNYFRLNNQSYKLYQNFIDKFLEKRQQRFLTEQGKLENISSRDKSNISFNQILLDIMKPRTYILEKVPQDRKLSEFLRIFDMISYQKLKDIKTKKMGLKGIKIIQEEINKLAKKMNDKKIIDSLNNLFVNLKKDMKFLLKIPQIEVVANVRRFKNDIYSDFLDYLQDSLISWKKQFFKLSKTELLDQIQNKLFADFLNQMYDDIIVRDINLISILFGNKYKKDLCQLNEEESVVYLKFFDKYLPFQDQEDKIFQISVDPTKGLLVLYFYKYYNKPLKPAVIVKSLIETLKEFTQYLRELGSIIACPFKKEQLEFFKEIITKIILKDRKSIPDPKSSNEKHIRENDYMENVLFLQKLNQHRLELINMQEDFEDLLRKKILRGSMAEKYLDKYYNYPTQDLIMNLYNNEIKYKNNYLILHRKNRHHLNKLLYKEIQYYYNGGKERNFFDDKNNTAYFEYIIVYNECYVKRKREDEPLFPGMLFANSRLLHLSCLSEFYLELYFKFFSEILFGYPPHVFKDFVFKLLLDASGGFGLLSYYIYNNSPYYRLNRRDFFELQKFILRFQYDNKILIYQDMALGNVKLKKYCRVLEQEYVEGLESFPYLDTKGFSEFYQKANKSKNKTSKKD